MNYKPLFVLLFASALFACERRDIVCPATGTDVLIPMSIRWDKAKIANPAEGVTLLLYREDGSLYRHYDASSTSGTYMLKNIRVNDADSTFQCDLRVEAGRYHAVVFNETIRPGSTSGIWVSGILNENLESLRFRGVERMETFEAFASEYVDTRSGTVLKSKSGESIVSNPGILAAWHSQTPLVVTEEMMSASEEEKNQSTELKALFSQLLEIHPERKVMTIEMKFLVMNLSQVHPSSFTHTQLQGLAGSYFLGLQRYSATAVTHQFSLHSAKYSRVKNVPDTLTANYTTFGLLGDVPTPVSNPRYFFDTNVLLYDTENGSPWRYIPQVGDDENDIKVLPQDITVSMLKAFDAMIHDPQAELELELDLALWIYIPDDFSPWNKSESGFGGQVNDWINEDIEIRF